MHQNLTLLLFLCNFCGSAQLYVQEGTIFSLDTSETILSSQESTNQINAPINREGTLFLNSESNQQLLSTKKYLELPNLRIENSDYLYIGTALDIKNQLILESGQLKFYDVALANPMALVLTENANVCLSVIGQLSYTRTQLVEISHSLVLQQLKIVLKDMGSMDLLPFLVFRNNYNIDKTIRLNEYKAYLKQLTHPPKKMESG